MHTADTQSWVGRLSQDEGEECLSNLQALAGQLNSAMEAIVKGKLPLLQDSLQSQETSCARLANLRHRSIGRLKEAADVPANFIDSDLAVEIEAATETLVMLNTRYSALLKHSGDTLRLLAGLYRSYRGFAQPVSGIQASLQTWSCEV